MVAVGRKDGGWCRNDSNNSEYRGASAPGAQSRADRQGGCHWALAVATLSSPRMTLPWLGPDKGRQLPSCLRNPGLQGRGAKGRGLLYWVNCPAPPEPWGCLVDEEGHILQTSSRRPEA